MEDYRNTSRKNLSLKKFLSLSQAWRRTLLALATASILSFLAAAFVPGLLFRHRPPAQVDLLRKQERAIITRLTNLRAEVTRQGQYLAASLPQGLEKVWQTFEKLHFDREKEGIAYLKGNEMLLWQGQVVPPYLLPPADGRTHILRYKASVLLAAVFPVRKDEKIACLRLLSFNPPLVTPLLPAYSFLSAKEKENALIDFYPDDEDTSGLEEIFKRHRDEYIGQPRSANDILTIFFPLRNEKKKIIGTVNLRSPIPAALLSSRKNLWLRLSWCLGLAFFLSLSVSSFGIWKKANFQAPPAMFSLVAGFFGCRVASWQLVQLGGFSAGLASPAFFSLPFVARLLASPVDIFLTSLLFFLSLVVLLIDRRAFFSSDILTARRLSKVCGLFLALGASLPLYGFYVLASAIVFNSGANLLRFSPFLVSLFLFLSLVFFLASASLTSWLFLRLARKIWPVSLAILGLPTLSFLYWLLAASFPAVSWERRLLLIFPLAGLCLTLSLPGWKKKPGYRFLGLALLVALLHLTLRFNLNFKEKNLTEKFLQQSVLSQENWAQHFLEDSLFLVDAANQSIISFLRDGKEGPIARSIWERTSLGRWNWYSSLEILDPTGRLLSRFSLNIPQFFRPPLSLPQSYEWTLLRASLPFPGKDRDFLIGYRDVEENNRPLGRIIFYVLLDEEMLPFLYSAIPYFDLLRFPSVPSLKNFPFGVAVFKSDGQITFNPSRLTTGISVDDLKRLAAAPEKAIWSSLVDQGRHFRVYYFWNREKIVAVFWPQPGFISIAVEYLKLFFPCLLLVYLPLFIIDSFSRHRRLVAVFWAFSSRVYASFLAIIVILLIPSSLLIQSFFNRLASERFRERAEIQARVARNIIEDFLFLQNEEPEAPVPLQDLVLWVSTAVGNDVNVYEKGELAASSRQEFFESGILPEWLEGAVVYQLLQERKPYVVWRKKIGNYSFQNLTVPFSLNGSLLLINLAFPLERRKMARFQEEVFEFISFIAALSLVLVFLFARSIGSLVINPVKKVLAATKEVSSGNLDVFVDHQGHDELQTLVDGFNRMVFSLKKHERELAEMSKKAAWAEMARKVAHEVKNPLTPIRLSAEHLLRVYEERPEEMAAALRESVSYIISEVENLRRIAQDFLAFSREGLLEKKPFPLAGLIKEIILPYQRVLTNRVEFHLGLPENIQVTGDQEKLKVAFRNLIINAVEAIKGKGRIAVEARQDAGGVVIEVEDTGEGIDPRTRDRIFEPDFSTKDLGTGLGLPIAKKIIEDHGGTIDLSSELGKGTRVKVFLPNLPPA